MSSIKPSMKCPCLPFNLHSPLIHCSPVTLAFFYYWNMCAAILGFNQLCLSLQMLTFHIQISTVAFSAHHRQRDKSALSYFIFLPHKTRGTTYAYSSLRGCVQMKISAIFFLPSLDLPWFCKWNFWSRLSGLGNLGNVFECWDSWFINIV
jgi:hypothetical protein